MLLSLLDLTTVISINLPTPIYSIRLCMSVYGEETKKFFSTFKQDGLLVFVKIIVELIRIKNFVLYEEGND